MFAGAAAQGIKDPCVSTRFILKCAPAMYYRWELKDDDNNEAHQVRRPPSLRCCACGAG